MLDWLTKWLTDPQVLAALNWFGTVITLVGFIIAFIQLRKTETAAVAAENAVRYLSELVQGREQLLELNSAVGFIENARDALVQGNREGASIYIELTSSKLIQAVELMKDTPDEAEQVRKSSRRLKRLSEALTEVPRDVDQEAFTKLAIDARNIAHALQAPAAKLRYHYDIRGKNGSH